MSLYIETRKGYIDAAGKQTLGVEELKLASEVMAEAGVLVATPTAHQADSAAADVAGVVADFNALLAKLQAAGLML